MKTITQLTITGLIMALGLGACGVSIEDGDGKPNANVFSRSSLQGQYSATQVSVWMEGDYMTCDMSLAIKQDSKKLDIESLLFKCADDISFGLDEVISFSIQTPEANVYFVYDLYHNSRNSGFISTNNDELNINFRDDSAGFNLKVSRFGDDTYLDSFELLVGTDVVLTAFETKLTKN